MVESDSESNASASSASSSSGSSSSEGECSTSSQSEAESKPSSKQVLERDDENDKKRPKLQEEKPAEAIEKSSESPHGENGKEIKKETTTTLQNEPTKEHSEPLKNDERSEKSTTVEKATLKEGKEKNKSPVRSKSRSRSPRRRRSGSTHKRNKSQSGSPRKNDKSRSQSRSRRRKSPITDKSRERRRSRSRSPRRRRRSRSRSNNRRPRSSSLDRRREERKRRHAERDKRDEAKRGRRDDSQSPRRRSDKSPNKPDNNEIDNATVTDPKAKITDRQRRTVDLLTSRTGGAYIPPAKLRMMQAEITDKSSAAYQRIAWEALKKSIHGYINKVNVDNIAIITRELLKENIVRGRGLLCRSIIQAQAASPTFTHVYAALVSIINSKFPKIGELLLTRLVVQFKRAFRRNDKGVCLSSSRFVAHLVNQRVAHEILALEILTLLVETPTDDSVEVAIAFLKECGMKLSEVSSKGIGAIFEMLKNILHEGKLDKRVQYMIEVVFQVRKDGFKDHLSVMENLELVEEDDQFTHLLMLDDATNTEDVLNVFKFDENYAENEDKYKGLSKEILGSDDSDSDGSGSSGSGSESDDSDDDAEDKEAKATAGEIIDNTETNLIALRRTIYLTINSSLDYEECAHKLMKMQLKPGQEIELCHMFLDCCAEQRTYEKFYGLLAQRFCSINKIYIEPFEEIFRDTYQTTHRLDTNRLRNVSKFFAHLLFTDAISWDVLECIKLNEDDTTSSSRIFVKILFQELAEYMGLAKLNNKLKEDVLLESLAGLFPKDNPRNTRFSINFFTSIGLGGLTDDLRRFLKTAPKVVQAINADILASQPVKEKSSTEESSSSSSSTSSSSESSSSSSGSESSDSEPNRKRKNKVNKKNQKEKEKEKKKLKKQKAKAKAKKLNEKETQKKKRKTEQKLKKSKSKKKRKEESSSSSSDSSESADSSSSSNSSGSSDDGSSDNESHTKEIINKKEKVKHKNRIDHEEFNLNSPSDRRHEVNGNGRSHEPQRDRRVRDEELRDSGKQHRRHQERVEDSSKDRRERGERDEIRRNDRREHRPRDVDRDGRDERRGGGVRDEYEERRDRRRDRKDDDNEYNGRDRRDRRDRGEDAHDRRERDRQRVEYNDDKSRKHKKDERRRESPDARRYHSRNTSKERG